MAVVPDTLRSPRPRAVRQLLGAWRDGSPLRSFLHNGPRPASPRFPSPPPRRRRRPLLRTKLSITCCRSQANITVHLSAKDTSFCCKACGGGCGGGDAHWHWPMALHHLAAGLHATLPPPHPTHHPPTTTTLTTTRTKTHHVHLVARGPREGAAVCQHLRHLHFELPPLRPGVPGVVALRFVRPPIIAHTAEQLHRCLGRVITAAIIRGHRCTDCIFYPQRGLTAYVQGEGVEARHSVSSSSNFQINAAQTQPSRSTLPIGL